MEGRDKAFSPVLSSAIEFHSSVFDTPRLCTSGSGAEQFTPTVSVRSPCAEVEAKRESSVSLNGTFDTFLLVVCHSPETKLLAEAKMTFHCVCRLLHHWHGTRWINSGHPKNLAAATSVRPSLTERTGTKTHIWLIW